MSILRALSSPYDLDESVGGDFWDTPAGVAPDVQDHITLRGGEVVAGFGIGEPVTTVWVGFSLQKGQATATPDKGFIEFYDRAVSETQALFRIKKINNNNSNCRLQMWNGTAWVDNGLAIVAFNTTALIRVDVELVMATEGGAFRVYINGTMVAEITGNTNPTGSAGVNWIDLYNWTGNPNNSDNYRTTFSGMIVADEDTRDLFVVQRKPTGDGTVSGWTGDYQDVTATAFAGLPGDSTFLSSTEENQVSTFTVGSLAAYELETIEAVVVSTRFRLEGEGISAVTALVGTDEWTVQGDPMSSDAVFRGHASVFPLNADGLPWEFADIEGAQFGVLSSLS